MLLGLSSSRKGSITSAMLKAYGICWFTNPNQDLTSVRVSGVEKLESPDVFLSSSCSICGDFEACEF